MRIVSRRRSEDMPARIGPLSVLPVFLDLAGKRAVVAGGSDAAAWKAELLAAAGAHVAVCAPDEELSDGMRRLAACQPRVLLHERTWRPDDLDGASVALADAGDGDEAAVFHAAARQAGAPCNVIDKPEFCDFQFGAIVNRSPVVVGISTAGAAPILGQAIRRRIETLLPQALADWATLARRLRDRVSQRLAAGPQRRAFWEWLSERAFGPAPAPDCEREVEVWMRSAASSDTGRVTFVGAGPGDPELLTLKAVRALQAADLILFDEHVADGVLELARREAKRVAVSTVAARSGGGKTEIELMAATAGDGRRVVRLMQGGGVAFGNAVDEISALEAAGIACEIVPGVSAGIHPVPARRAGLRPVDGRAEVRALRRA